MTATTLRWIATRASHRLQAFDVAYVWRPAWS